MSASLTGRAAMKSTWMIWIVLAAALWFVARVIALAFTRRSQPADPDDYAEVPANLRPRPRPGASAVALAEPDDDGDLIVHPRLMRRTHPR
jgi:hypothetical protein